MVERSSCARHPRVRLIVDAGLCGRFIADVEPIVGGESVEVHGEGVVAVEECGSDAQPVAAIAVFAFDNGVDSLAGAFGSCCVVVVGWIDFRDQGFFVVGGDVFLLGFHGSLLRRVGGRVVLWRRRAVGQYLFQR